jgi:hypothetical protein
MSIPRLRRRLVIPGAAAVAVIAGAATVTVILSTRSTGATMAGVDGTASVAGYPSGAVFTAAPGTSDKQRLVTLGMNAAAPKNVLPPEQIHSLDHNEWLYADGDRTVSLAGGQSGQIRSSGRVFAEAPLWDTQKHHATYSHSKSLVAWLGTSPLNADSVTQTDQWVSDTYGGPAKISGGPPGAVVGTPGSLVWKTQVANNWISLHSWPGPISVVTTGVVYQVGYRVTGTFQFGSTFFSVSGQDAAGV